ncbi:carbohydrate ABC transporter substrate-binding protein, partial [bacterium]|nr:carbohydrate ABC transporter substrate-binding protein [bacterium]
PCNVNVVGFWANVEAFERYGMEPPPEYWDVETFERTGREFVKRANPPGQRRTVFFSSSPLGELGDRLLTALHRSLGLSIFNETMTRCTLDDERYVRVLAMIYRWVHVDHLMPTAADEASFATQAGYGGATLSLFQSGNYATVITGRWFLIRVRDFQNPPRVSVSNFPVFEFPNAVIRARTAGVYAGSKHPDLAVLFLAYLASESYNMQIVRDADALPPNPIFTRTDAYLRPADHPNEWGAHEIPAEAAKTIAISDSNSPFVPRATVERILRQGREEVLANLSSPSEAARTTARRINEEIDRRLENSSDLRKRYDSLVECQAEIERRRKAEEKVPLEWITDPFHRRYYSHQGWGEN